MFAVRIKSFINKIFLINKNKLLNGVKMTEKIEMGTVSSRGQICIPSSIREDLGLKEGSKILFVLMDDSLIIKKVNMQTFAEITKPLKEAARKSGMKESEVNGIIHRFRSKQTK